MINRELSEHTRKLMKVGSKSGSLDSPVALWREIDILRGQPEETAVVIFRTTGCSWYKFSSCTMCGYFNDVSPGVKEENLMKQIDKLTSSLENIKVLKVFTSGSFLDPQEVPVTVRKYFFDSLEDKIDKFLIESRTEYLHEKNLQDNLNDPEKVRIAIGLESSNDLIIRDSINKGSTFSKYVTAAKTARGLGFEVRTYLLFKPPFISEKEAMRDTLDSVRDASPYSNDISINPMNIQKNTLVEYLWKRGLYRPPRLWSVAKLLVQSLKEGYSVVSYPTGGNRIRGAHNNKPDGKLLNLIFEASLKQNPDELDSYIQQAELSEYENEMEIEDRQIFQSDYFRLVSRLSSLSTSL